MKKGNELTSPKNGGELRRKLSRQRKKPKYDRPCAHGCFQIQIDSETPRGELEEKNGIPYVTIFQNQGASWFFAMFYLNLPAQRASAQAAARASAMGGSE